MILATILVTYTPVIAFDYAYADDYWVLQMRPLNHYIVYGWSYNNNTEGRPLLSIWQLGVCGLCQGIQGLNFVRLLAVIGIFLSSLVFYKLLRRYLIKDRIDAALVASIFAVNPCFLIVGGWAENGFISYGCFFGLLASYVLLRDDPSDTPSNPLSLKRQRWGQISQGALLLFAAVFLYQPTLMIFWTGIAVWLLGQFTDTRRDWLKLVHLGIVFSGVIVGYFIICHTFWPPSDRFHISLSFFRRIGWFAFHPMHSTLSYPFIEPKDVWSILALYILSFGIWSYCRRTSRTMWIPPLILLLTPVTLLPIIVAYVHYDVSRARGAIYGLIILLWAVTLGEIVQRYGKNIVTLRHVLIPVLILVIVSGQYHLDRYFIMPQLWDESALLIKLQEFARENPKLDRAIALRPPPTDITEFKGVDEMGFASVTRTWVPNCELPIILAGVVHRNVEDLPPLKIIAIGADEPVPGDAFLIDLARLRAPR